MKLTIKEKEFIKYFKNRIRFKGFKIKEKISIYKLGKDVNEISFLFGNNTDLINDIVVDFVIEKNNKVIAGIELIDEEDELELSRGKQMLIDTFFKTIGAKYFRIVDLNNLKDAANIISSKIIK